MNLEQNQSGSENVLDQIVRSAEENKATQERKNNELERDRYIISMLDSARDLRELYDRITTLATVEEHNSKKASDFSELKKEFVLLQNQLAYVIDAANGMHPNVDGQPNSLREVIKAWPNTPFGVVKIDYGFARKVEQLLGVLAKEQGIVDVEL